MPFEANIEYPRHVDGQAMSIYIEWMASCCIMVLQRALPVGARRFQPEGLPVGLQIVGRPGDDWGVLQLAYAFQEHTGHWRRSAHREGYVLTWVERFQSAIEERLPDLTFAVALTALMAVLALGLTPTPPCQPVAEMGRFPEFTGVHHADRADIIPRPCCPKHP